MRGRREASPAHGLARVFSAAAPAARHPTFDTTRETHRASPRTPPATGPTRVGIYAACRAPRRHTMPSAQAVVKRGGGARRTSVSQSWKGTGHFVRLYFRPRCPGRGHNRRILLESGAPGRIRTCDPRLRRPDVWGIGGADHRGAYHSGYFLASICGRGGPESGQISRISARFGRWPVPTTGHCHFNWSCPTRC